jgi:UDPglucose 6-dehydrogenase
VKALARSAAQAGTSHVLLDAVEAVNEAQKRVLASKVVARYGEDLTGKTFAVWGLAFKPDTDDMREASSRVVIAELLRRGAKLRAYDPVAATEARRVLELDLGEDAVQAGLAFVDSALDALEGTDALIIITEWKEFRSPDFATLAARLADRIVFDGRNLYDPALVRAHGLSYLAIGRP